MTLTTRWDGRQYGTEVREGEHLCVHRADSLHCTAETSTRNIIKWPCVCVCVRVCSVVSDSSQPYGLEPSRRLSRELPRRECWSGLPFAASGSLPSTGIKPASLEPPAVDRRTLYHFTRQEALKQLYCKWGRKKDLTSTWFSNGPLHIQSHDLGQIHRLEKCTLYFDKLHFKKTAIVRWNGPLQPCFLPHLSRSVFLFYFSAWHLQVIKIILGINLATPL